jgi:hypothetical protein
MNKNNYTRYTKSCKVKKKKLIFKKKSSGKIAPSKAKLLLRFPLMIKTMVWV